MTLPINEQASLSRYLMPYTWTSVIAGMETLGGSRDYVSLPVMDVVSGCVLIDTRSSKTAQRWMTHSDISITSGQCVHTATHNTHNWLALRLVVFSCVSRAAHKRRQRNRPYQQWLCQKCCGKKELGESLFIYTEASTTRLRVAIESGESISVQSFIHHSSANIICQ